MDQDRGVRPLSFNSLQVINHVLINADMNLVGSNSVELVRCNWYDAIVCR